MSLYLKLDTTGRGMCVTAEDMGFEITDYPDLVRVVEQPRNYLVVEGELQYSGLYQPSYYHHQVDEVWVLNQKLLTDDRFSQWEKIKDRRDTKKYQGFSFLNVYDGKTYWIHSDIPSRIQHVSLLITALMSLLNIKPFPTDLDWKTLEKGEDGQPIKVHLTANIVFLMFAAEMTMEAQMFQNAERLREEIEASLDPINHNIESGWPVTFEDFRRSS